MAFKPLLWTLALACLGPSLVRAYEPGAFTLGGGVRAGSFGLASYPSLFDLSPGYSEGSVQNTVGSRFFAEHWVLGWGFYGVGYDQYRFATAKPNLNQSLVLQVGQWMVGAAHSVDFQRAKLTFGLRLGQGPVRYQAKVTRTPTQTDPNPKGDESFTGTGQATRGELFFGAQIQNGWGYRFSLLGQDGALDQTYQGEAVTLHAAPSASLTLVWRP